MKKIKDLCVATNKYTNRDGVEKTNWLNIGSIMEKDDGGKFMLLDRCFNPAGVPNPENRSNLIVSMFDIKPKESEGADKIKDAFNGTDAPEGSHFSDKEIPF